MRKRKFFSLLLAIVMLVTYVLAGQAPTSADQISTDNSLMYQEYVREFLEEYENFTPVITSCKTLLDVETNLPTAYCFEFNNGYIIVSINSMSVYELSICNPSPYAGLNATTPLYYNGVIEYYIKNEGIYSHLLSDLNGNSQYTMLIDEEDIVSSMVNDPLLSENQKLEKLYSIMQSDNLNASTTLAERYLNGILTTAWLNGYCGPTAAHTMLRYLGFTDRSRDQYDVIQELTSYTGSAVTLESLRSGINNYLVTHNYNASVRSCSYSFDRVMTEIDSNQPLTLGRSGSSQGHVVTVHGYKVVRNEELINYVYFLYVNDSWGRNNVQLWYDNNNNPHNFVDHVYY